MYAVIRTGGKQYKVTEGERLDVEKVTGEELSFVPLMLVDGDTVLAGLSIPAGASVAARVVGEGRGKKIRGFTYKNKTNQRKRWGHRQSFSTIEITGITKG
jgi:large subunit ribosomal protein L21